MANVKSHRYSEILDYHNVDAPADGAMGEFAAQP